MRNCLTGGCVLNFERQLRSQWSKQINSITNWTEVGRQILCHFLQHIFPAEGTVLNPGHCDIICQNMDIIWVKSKMYALLEFGCLKRIRSLKPSCIFIWYCSVSVLRALRFNTRMLPSAFPHMASFLDLSSLHFLSSCLVFFHPCVYDILRLLYLHWLHNQFKLRSFLCVLPNTVINLRITLIIKSCFMILKKCGCKMFCLQFY